MIIDRDDMSEKKDLADQTRYHDVTSILYHDHTMFDLELIINDNQHFQVHRAILAAGSDYFKTLLQNQSNQTNQMSLSLKVNEIEAFPWMLKFLYTGTIAKSTLNFDQIELFMKLANIYQIPTLSKTLFNLITAKIDANNCLRLLFLEHYFGDQWINIRKESIKTAALNFFNISHQVEFLKLPFDVLADILNHSEILIANQSMFYLALMRWSKNQPEHEDEDAISEYLIPDRYQTSFNKCNEVYRIPSAIVCFLADGSEKYTKMTINAINSFLKSTPHVMIGILLMDLDIKTLVLSQIDRIYHYRLIFKRVSKSPLIQNWNPTQYKMDIIKFAQDGFQEIFWMDSDTIVYKDMTSVLYDFRSSNQQFYFVPDHVMFDINFMNNWRREHPETFIPQACFMGFKSSIISAFFLLWKQSWIKWVESEPFSNFKDPNPTFVGSAFCTEQYALGNAVYHFITKHTSSVVLNENFLWKYIKKIERTVTIINSGHPEEAQLTQAKEKLTNLSNTNLLSMTSLSMTSLYYYASFPMYSWCSQICQQKLFSTYGSFVAIRGDVSSVMFTNTIDRFFDCFFHFYNQNYDIAYEWYLKNFP